MRPGDQAPAVAAPDVSGSTVEDKPGPWVSTKPPPGASSAARQVTQRPHGWVEVLIESTFTDNVRDGTVEDDYLVLSTTTGGVTTTTCRFSRVNVVTDQVGPDVRTRGQTKIVDGGSHITWQLSFTDTGGQVTKQVGATALNSDGSGAQSVTTTTPDGSGIQEHMQWTDAANATRRTETSDSDGNTTQVDNSTVSSSGNGAWQTVGVPPTRYNDPSVDALPPPFGPRGPVIVSDVIDQLQPTPPTTPSS
jgi:hypothetical protein